MIYEMKHKSSHTSGHTAAIPAWDEMNRLQIFIRKVPSKPNENEHVFLGWQAP